MLRVKTRIASVATVLFVAITLTGCFSSSEVVNPTVSVSVGQQLIDLKKAHDSGALTDSEYKSQKAKLIKNVE